MRVANMELMPAVCVATVSDDFLWARLRLALYVRWGHKRKSILSGCTMANFHYVATFRGAA
jgi:hypothetical protein